MTTITSSETERQAFRQRLQELLASGRLDEAISHCDEVELQAETAGDQDLADKAYCNRAGILIARGDGGSVVAKLRLLLLRSSDLQNRFSASYHISCIYDQQEDHQKSLFYAQQALRYATELGEDEALSCANNRLANLLVLDSYFTEAISSYRAAFALLPAHDSVERALLLSNVGYCRVVTGELNEGYKDLTSSLRMLRRLQADHWQHVPYLSLSYACLEVERYPRAKKHAARALELAEASNHRESVKKALYLLGEAEKLSGDSVRAFECFSELQRKFYPENPHVLDVLMVADVRNMINLMA